ncbi:MAG: nuclear transport factor 2 family protein [bacterium]|nr:nuclear transport factor 2 family protein [bacterium]
MPENNAAIQELLDKKACEELLARYACALEWIDEEALRAVFFADADVDYGFFKGRGDEFVPAMMAQIRGCLRTWHNNGTPLLRISGDEAQAETHGTGATIVEIDGQTVTSLLGGRYLDRLERRDGAWGIAKRVYVVDWHQTISRDSATEALPGMNMLMPSAEHSLYRRL